MDQCFSDFGFNDNAFLFKNSEWSKNWLKDGLAFMDQDVIQADNGGFMEQMLISLGAEAEARNKTGYGNTCKDLLIFEGALNNMWQNPAYWDQNRKYAQCFFSELARLAGYFNKRDKSRHIRFNPLMDQDDIRLQGSEYHYVPWANCWSLIVDPHASTRPSGATSTTHAFNCKRSLDPVRNCFAYHWNGNNKLKEDHSTIKGGTCPDPTFDWSASPFNWDNRGH